MKVDKFYKVFSHIHSYHRCFFLNMTLSDNHAYKFKVTKFKHEYLLPEVVEMTNSCQELTVL